MLTVRLTRRSVASMSANEACGWCGCQGHGWRLKWRWPAVANQSTTKL